MKTKKHKYQIPKPGYASALDEIDHKLNSEEYTIFDDSIY